MCEPSISTYAVRCQGMVEGGRGSVEEPGAIRVFDFQGTILAVNTENTWAMSM